MNISKTSTFPVIIIFIAYLNAFEYVNGESIDFNEKFTGVSFIPYVKDPKYFSYTNQYTFDELKTMLKVISTKFSRVVTASLDAPDVKYISKHTYYNEACIITRASEAAAVINRENNANNLRVTIGVKLYSINTGGERRTETEMKLAIEAYQIAQRIYPGTVRGFQLSNDFSETGSVIADFYWVHFLRNRTNGTNLLVGVLASALDFWDIMKLDKIPSIDIILKNAYNGFRNTPKKNLLVYRKLTSIAISDFITLKYFANANLVTIHGPKESFSIFGEFLLAFKNFTKKLKGEMDIMGYTGWDSAGRYSFQNIEILEEYWTEVNRFTAYEQVLIWFHEAFDNPWKKYHKHDAPYYGWWRLNENCEANKVSSYVEKVARANKIERRCTSTTRQSTTRIDQASVYFGLVMLAGGLVPTLLIFGLHQLYKRNLFLGKFLLSKEEIIEFNNGSPEDGENMAQEGYEVFGFVMQRPYNINLEIAEEMLEIYWDRIIDEGQYCSVHMALLKGETLQEVALKTAKKVCPANTLRGLLSEIKILTHLEEHSNIVCLRGAYTAELAKGKLYVALELCEMGSLRDHLRKLGSNGNVDRVTKLELENLLRWSYEIASGMEHIGNKGVIHAGLSTRNVLLTNGGTAKISDFSLSTRFLEYAQYAETGEEPITWKWIALESLKTSKVSIQSDIWSFGVTLWEIFSLGAEPYPGYSCNSSFIEGLETGLVKLTQPSGTTSEIFQIILDCSQLKAHVRPSFSRVRTQILEIFAVLNYDVILDVKECKHPV